MTRPVPSDTHRVTSQYDPEYVRALASGTASSWGEHGSAAEHRRYMKAVQRRVSSRRYCPCCGNKITHVGMANGVTLAAGCEWSMRVWVRTARAPWQRVV
jgi:ribosomal protein L37AE/L43A